MIWEEPWDRAGGRSRAVNRTFTRNTTIYNGGSIRSICKKILRNCRESCPLTSSRLTLSQSRKSGLMVEKVRDYHSRRRERTPCESSNVNREILKALTELNALSARLAKSSQKLLDNNEQQMQRQECFKNDLAEIAALLGIGGKATTEEIPSAPAYGFIARNSLFPDPKHCSFFFTQHRRKSLICNIQKPTDFQQKSQLDPLNRRPWSCRPRSHQRHRNGATPLLRGPAYQAGLLTTEKFQAPDCTSSTTLDLIIFHH